jgi:dienelactone hydrolase
MGRLAYSANGDSAVILHPQAIGPAILLWTLWLFAAQGQAASLEDYGSDPSLAAVAISPDGSRLAYVRTDGAEHVVAVVSLRDRQSLAAFKLGSQRLRFIRWADTNRLMICTSTLYAPIVTTKLSTVAAPQSKPSAMAGSGTSVGASGFGSAILSAGQSVSVRREWSLLQIYDLNTHTAMALPDPAQLQPLKVMNVIAGDPMVRQVAGHTTLYVQGLFVVPHGIGDSFDESEVLRPALIRIDLDSGIQTVLRQGAGDNTQWLVDAGGEVVAEQAYSPGKLGKKPRWQLTILRDGRLQEAASGHEIRDYPRLLGLGPQPDTLLIQSLDGQDLVWKPLSLKDASVGPALAERSLLVAPIEQRTSHRIIGGVQIRDDVQYLFFDAAMQDQWNSVLHSFESAHVQLVSASDDFSRFVLRIESPKLGLKYQLIDLAGHKLDPIGNVYQNVTEPLEAHRIDYTAADGLPLAGYLTLPRGREAHNLALLVLPHSAISGADTADYDWWSQALTTLGYAVVRVNFRGSETSFAQMAAGVGEVGRKMQSDLSDGVRYLVDEGIADPKRVCIVGAAYGGYAALAGAALQPDLYRCAVSIAGVSDLSRWRAWAGARSDDRASPDQRGWPRFVDAAQSEASLNEISPLKHADAVRAPVLLMHARDDDFIPFEQSQRMYDALRHAGKTVELVALEPESELLSSSANRTAMLRKVAEFLRVHNPSQ